MGTIHQGQGIALGITVDSDNDVVVLVTVMCDEEDGWCAMMMPDVARHFGRAARDLSREADRLQDELDDLDPEEIEDRLFAIRARYLTDQTPPA